MFHLSCHVPLTRKDRVYWSSCFLLSFYGFIIDEIDLFTFFVFIFCCKCVSCLVAPLAEKGDRKLHEVSLMSRRFLKKTTFFLHALCSEIHHLECARGRFTAPPSVQCKAPTFHIVTLPLNDFLCSHKNVVTVKDLTVDPVLHPSTWFYLCSILALVLSAAKITHLCLPFLLWLHFFWLMFHVFITLSHYADGTKGKERVIFWVKPLLQLHPPYEVLLLSSFQHLFFHPWGCLYILFRILEKQKGSYTDLAAAPLHLVLFDPRCICANDVRPLPSHTPFRHFWKNLFCTCKIQALKKCMWGLQFFVLYGKRLYVLGSLLNLLACCVRYW